MGEGITPIVGPQGNDRVALENFSYDGRRVRTLVIDGEPWFVAVDVCAILGLTNITEALRGLDEDEFRTAEVVDSAGRRQRSYVVNEPGLYSLILRSRKPEAKAFKRWITHEVLPAIRKTGSYSVPDPRTPALPSSYSAALRELANEVEARELAEQRVAELEPKAEAFDHFLNAEGVYLIGTVAKMLDIGPNILFARLREEHILISQGARRNTPYQQYMKHFRVVARDYDNGEIHRSGFTTFVRPSGVDWIRKVLRLQEALPIS